MILDDIDFQILKAVQEDCRITNKDLAARVHLSTTPTFERLKRLERMGFIQRYVAVLDAAKLNRGFHALCYVSLKQVNTKILDEFRQAVQSWLEVSECYNISGESDFMMKVFVQDMSAYQKFIVEKVNALAFVTHVKSVFIMDTLKLTYGVPV